MKKIRLSLNIYHVSTLRKAKNGDFPEPLLISKNLTLDNFNNITPTLQEALDIIEIEEIERALNI